MNKAQEALPSDTPSVLLVIPGGGGSAQTKCPSANHSPSFSQALHLSSVVAVWVLRASKRE